MSSGVVLFSGVMTKPSMSSQYFSPSIRFFMEDFKGWHKRPLLYMMSGETALLSTLFYYEDVQKEGSPYHKFFRWRGQVQDPYEHISSGLTKPFRLAVNVVRETYKFRYSVYQEGDGEKRTLLSRLGSGPKSEESSPVPGYVMEGDPDTEQASVQRQEEKEECTFQTLSAEELRLRSKRKLGRQRSASPPMLRASSGSPSSHVSRRRDREEPFRLSSRNTPSMSSLGSCQSGLQSLANPSIQDDAETAALILSIVPDNNEAYPTALPFVPRWSR